jgi:hypothetical protein
MQVNKIPGAKSSRFLCPYKRKKINESTFFADANLVGPVGTHRWVLEPN